MAAYLLVRAEVEEASREKFDKWYEDTVIEFENVEKARKFYESKQYSDAKKNT